MNFFLVRPLSLIALVTIRYPFPFVIKCFLTLSHIIIYLFIEGLNLNAGDVCTGDVVQFLQKVYKKYSLVHVQLFIYVILFYDLIFFFKFTI